MYVIASDNIEYALRGRWNVAADEAAPSAIPSEEAQTLWQLIAIVEAALLVVIALAMWVANRSLEDERF